MPEEFLDVERMLQTLHEHGVDYVLIGGMAVIVHGSTRLTQDADFAIAFNVENRRKLVEALRPLHPRPMRLALGAAWVWDEACVRPPWSIFRTDAGRLDIVLRLPGIESFQALRERAEMYEIAGIPTPVASIADLIKMKSSSDRPKDHDDVHQLRVIESVRAKDSELT